MSDSENRTKKSLKSSSSKRNKKTKSKKTKKIKSKIENENEESPKKFKELNLSIKNRNNINDCLSHLELFFKELNTNDLDNLLTEKNVEKFQKIREIENIEIDLFLTKFYNKIFNSENLYSEFFADPDDNEIKVSLVLVLIDETVKIIENLEDYVISKDNFELKRNILKLIKFLKINLKEDMNEEDKKQLDKYLNDLPNKFYSENYLEIIKYKNIICKNNYELLKNIENIDELFSGLESYYEQLSAIEILFNDIEVISKNNSDKNNYISVSNKDIKKKKKKKKSKKNYDSDTSEEMDITNSKDKKEEITEDELIIYGQFLMNTCLYHKFQLITKEKKKKNKKSSKKSKQKIIQKSNPKQKPKIKKRKKSTEDEEENEEEDEEKEDEDESEDKNKENKNNNIEESEDEEEEEESEDDPQNILNLFVIDAVKNVNGRIQQKSNENIELSELLEDKICLSLMERNNLLEIVKKNIKNFKTLTQRSKNPEIKKINKKFDLYIKSLEEDKYIPINKDNINSIKYYNNFIKNTIVIPNRDSRVFYIENTENQKGLLLVEYELEDETKDIIFSIGRYDLEKDDFNQIYTSDKTNKKCKLCVYFEEKSLYQITFDNEYSWLNSKQINFTISMFKILERWVFSYY